MTTRHSEVPGVAVRCYDDEHVRNAVKTLTTATSDGIKLPDGHVFESNRLQRHRRLRRIYDWNTTSHFYPDLIDQTAVDIDDEEPKNPSGTFYRWESGRRRRSERKKYPRWTASFRRVTDGHATMTSPDESQTSKIVHATDPDVVDGIGRVKSGECGERLGVTGSSTVKSTTAAVKTFRRLQFVSSSLNEKRRHGRGEHLTVAKSHTTAGRMSRRLSDPVPRAESVDRKLGSGTESSMSVARCSTFPRKQTTRNLLVTVDESDFHPQVEQDDSHVTQVGQSTKIATESRRRWSNRLTAMINSGSRTRRQFVRQRCRRLIGWDPFDGFEPNDDEEDFQRTKSTDRKPRIHDETLVNAEQRSKSNNLQNDETDVEEVAQTTFSERVSLALERNVTIIGNERPSAVNEAPSLPRIVVDHVTEGDHGHEYKQHHLNLGHDESGVTRQHESQAKKEDNGTDGETQLDNSDRSMDVVSLQRGRESVTETSQVEVITEQKWRKLQDNSDRESRQSVTEKRESTTAMSSLPSVERRSPIIDEYDHLLYRISTNLRQQTKAAACAGGQSPDFRRSLDNVLRKGHRAHERRLLQRRSTGVASEGGATVVVRDRTDSTAGPARSGDGRPETNDPVAKRRVVTFDCAVRDLSVMTSQERVCKSAAAKKSCLVSDRRTMRDKVTRTNDVTIDASSSGDVGEYHKPSCRRNDAVDLGDDSCHVVPVFTDGIVPYFDENHDAESAKETKADLSQSIAKYRTKVEVNDLLPEMQAEMEWSDSTTNVTMLDTEWPTEKDGASYVDGQESSDVYVDSRELVEHRKTRDLINEIEKKTQLELRSKSTDHQRNDAKTSHGGQSQIRRNIEDDDRSMCFRDTVDHQKGSPAVTNVDHQQLADGRSKVFTVTGFPVPRPVSPLSNSADRPQPSCNNEDSTRSTNDERHYGDSTWCHDDGRYNCESADEQVDERCRTRRRRQHYDINWQTVEAELDADKWRMYRYVTERVVSPTPFASGQYSRYHMHQRSLPCLRQPAAPTSRQAEPLSCSKRQRRRSNEYEPSALPPSHASTQSRGTGTNVPIRRTYRGEDRLEYELPVSGGECIDWSVSAAAMTTEATLMTTDAGDRRSLIAPDGQHKVTDERTYRNSTGDVRIESAAPRRIGNDFPRITELLWILPARQSHTKARTPPRGQGRDLIKSSENSEGETISQPEMFLDIETPVAGRGVRDFPSEGTLKDRRLDFPLREDEREWLGRTDSACGTKHRTAAVPEVKNERPVNEISSRQSLCDADSRSTRPDDGIESTSGTDEGQGRNRGQGHPSEQFMNNDDGPRYLVLVASKNKTTLGSSDRTDNLDHIRYIDEEELVAPIIGRPTCDTDVAAICSDFRWTSVARGSTGISGDGSTTGSVERRVRFSFGGNDEQWSRLADDDRVCKSLRGICKYDALTKPRGMDTSKKVDDASTKTTAVDILWQKIIEPDHSSVDKHERPVDYKSSGNQQMFYCSGGARIHSGVNAISCINFDKARTAACNGRVIKAMPPHRLFHHKSVDSIPHEPRDLRDQVKGRTGSTCRNETAEGHVRLVSGSRFSKSAGDMSTSTTAVDRSKTTCERMRTDTSAGSVSENNNVASPDDSYHRRSIKELVETFEDMSIPLFKISSKTKN